MSGSRSATTAQPSPPPQRRAEQQTLNKRSYATPVTSPPLPVPRPGSRAAAPPPGGGRTFFSLLTSSFVHQSHVPFGIDVARLPVGRRMVSDRHLRWVGPTSRRGPTKVAMEAFTVNRTGRGARSNPCDSTADFFLVTQFRISNSRATARGCMQLSHVSAPPAINLMARVMTKQ